MNTKSPAWHMAQIRQTIKNAKTERERLDGVEARRQYWEYLQKKTSGLGPMSHLAEVSARMAAAARVA